MTDSARWSADELALGEDILRVIEDDTWHERHGWAPERVERVTARLEQHRPPDDRMVPVVLWMRGFTAFTAPGRYIYVSRRLLERCPDDEAAAFVVAHEIAHHDLGHIAGVPDWIPEQVRQRAGGVLAGFYNTLAHNVYGPERECDADRYALELCRRAGYDLDACIKLMDVLERFALDVGDHDAVFGPDPESDQELAIDAPWLTKARIWVHQRSRGYLPIQDRRASLRAHAELLQRPGGPSA
jgi:Zn-dependent protease with chaperone function